MRVTLLGLAVLAAITACTSSSGPAAPGASTVDVQEAWRSCFATDAANAAARQYGAERPAAGMPAAPPASRRQPSTNVIVFQDAVDGATFTCTYNAAVPEGTTVEWSAAQPAGPSWTPLSGDALASQVLVDALPGFSEVLPASSGGRWPIPICGIDAKREPSASASVLLADDAQESYAEMAVFQYATPAQAELVMSELAQVGGTCRRDKDDNGTAYRYRTLDIEPLTTAPTAGVATTMYGEPYSVLWLQAGPSIIVASGPGTAATDIAAIQSWLAAARTRYAAAA